MRTYWCVLRIFHVCVQLVVQAGAFGTTSALGHIWRTCPQHLRCRVTVSRFSLKYLRLPTCWGVDIAMVVFLFPIAEEALEKYLLRLLSFA